MSNKMDSLSDDEVRQISLLVETREKCSFDFLQLSVGNSSMLWNIRPGGMRFTGGAAR